MPDFPLFPESASSLAPQVDALYFTALLVSAFFSLLIAVVVFYLAIRYHRTSPEATGQSFKAPMSLEITWSVIPLIIVMIFFAWGAVVFLRATRPPADSLTYYVVGKQWMWKFQHPEGLREINELHVPVDQPVKLLMTSEDVIHSFFVPAFRTKMDVIPGRYTTIWFRPTKTGTFHLFCAEYCGAEHSLMKGSIVVMPPHEYEAFLAGATAGKSMAEAGEELFTQYACQTCHQEQDQGRGPSLRGVFGSTVLLEDGRTVVADEDYLRQSILQPAAKLVKGYKPLMPTFQGQIDEEGVLQLIAYLKTQGAVPTAPEPIDPSAAPEESTEEAALPAEEPR